MQSSHILADEPNHPRRVLRDVEVVADPIAAADLLDPLRSRILVELIEPGSATSLAPRLGAGRQKVNYHLRALEDHGLIGLVEERPRRGMVERIMQASARSYVVAPSAVGPAAPEPERTDRLSAGYLVSIAARLIGEVSDLIGRAERAGKPLATLTIDSEICFADGKDRAAFTDELAASVRELTARYHDESAAGGRWHRLIVASHPRPGSNKTRS